MSDIISVLKKRSAKRPHDTAFIFLQDGEQESDRITIGELTKRAEHIGKYLLEQGLSGERVMLLYPAGIDFVVSFIGCLYAGSTAVPVPCPAAHEFGQSLETLKLIAADADISAVLTCSNWTETVRINISQILPGKKLFVADTQKIKSGNKMDRNKFVITPDTIVYLQYTSGSTSTPKAAVIRHANLTHSLLHTARAWKYTKNSVTLTWAPHTHVYGLVCGLLLPLYHGTLSIIMPPAAFVSKPLLWLKAISKYRVTHSGCPNFGYEHCIKQIDISEMSGITLNTWKVAVNGGEHVQYDTLIRFNAKFEAFGFQLRRFNPAFGMSEASGAISISSYGKNPGRFSLDMDALQLDEVKFTTEDRHKIFVSNGRMLHGLKAVVVDPETLVPVGMGAIGEIWLTGKSVVQGYWRRQEENQAVFQARLAGSNQVYFRTGDLGFIYEDEICLTGRLKELIVINGKKYYPLDLENLIAERLTPLSIHDRRAVFSCPSLGNEKLVVVQEIHESIRQDSRENIIAAIRHAIIKEYGLAVDTVLLVARNSIPKTVSGKLQRKLCQKQYLENSLEILYQSVLNALPTVSGQINSLDTKAAAFAKVVASVLGVSAEQIDFHSPLSKYQFDSINIIQLTALLNETYGKSLSPAVLYEYQTLDEFYRDNIAVTMKIENKHSTDASEAGHRDIAIIGMSGVFPGAPDIDTFWKNLIEGKNSIGVIPSSRWDWKKYDGNPETDLGRISVKWGGFIDDIECFDAPFFNMSPREAELTDPQQRIFLQVVWNTVEDSGYSVQDIAHFKTGLFVGVFNHDYAELLHENNVFGAYRTTGTAASILANRVSYLLNLHGPSEAVDTACSSSLVAIHHAIMAILNGDCDLAIAGGVNALLSPTSFITASNAGMLSLDGQCKTFDKDANGFVRGEGVAAVLLKKLDRALADHDHIYGIIKGSAVNHGGHVNSLTAPNPAAQADVIMAAHERANIPVESITYIETHGTGTALGDPIEINGLKKAFSLLAERQGKVLKPETCGLGAVKSNIGHLESAAGIAGLIKILLAFKHEKIPSNLNFKTINPYIDLADSPFYLINKPQPWRRQQNSRPRRAGLSSFGYGGTNAHLVIEEVPDSVFQQTDYSPEVSLITLSARTTPALRQRIRDLHSWLGQQSYPPVLSDISHTLNSGRTHFEKRCAIIVDSIPHLQSTLAKVLEGFSPENYIDNTGLEWEKVSQSIDMIDSNTHLRKQEALSLWVVARQFVDGDEITWKSIPNHQPSCRVSLPGYPFEMRRFWIPGNETDMHAGKNDNGIWHIALDVSLSTSDNKRFSTSLTGKEWYFQDHKIKDSLVMPGAACMEMARTVGMLAFPEFRIIRLRDIVWFNAINAVKTLRLLINLKKTGNRVSFTVSDKESTEYASGEMDLHPASEVNRNDPAVNLVNLTMSLPHRLKRKEIYFKYRGLGFDYGSHFQVVEEARYNDEEAVACIRLGAPHHHLSASEKNICVLEGMLHAAMILLPKNAVYLPQAVSQVDYHGVLPDCSYAHIKLVPASADAIFTFDISLYDQAGQRVLEVRDFRVSELGGSRYKELHCYQPVWNECKINSILHGMVSSGKSILIFDDDHLSDFIRDRLPQNPVISQLSAAVFKQCDDGIFTHETDENHAFNFFHELNVNQSLPGWIIFRLPVFRPDTEFKENIHLQLHHIYHVLHCLAKALLQIRLNEPVQILFVNLAEYHQDISAFTQAIAGFARTLCDENPNLVCRVINAQTGDEVLDELTQGDTEVKYAPGGVRFVRRFQNITLNIHPDLSGLLTRGGVYLITGGMGGLGLIFARYLAKNYHAKLILTGRSLLDAAKESHLLALKQEGADAVYIQSDIASFADVQSLIQTIKAMHGNIDGIFHAAGAICDNFILRKPIQESASVLAPKVEGTLFLDEATKTEPLKFFVLFSSLASVLGNAGQSDYAYANGFMDYFSVSRESLRLAGKRTGKTLSINWPFWTDGGSSLSETARAWLENSMGVSALATADGMRIFEQILGSDFSQLMVMPGDKSKHERIFAVRNNQGTAISGTAGMRHLTSLDVRTHPLKEQTENYLKQTLASVIKTDPVNIQNHTAFEIYGIDSLMIIQLNQELGRVFNALPKTLFFEYQTLNDLTGYFLQHHSERLSQLFISDVTAVRNPMFDQAASAHISQPAMAARMDHKDISYVQDIAIIGLSGRYPQANDLETFWNHLQSGKDCVTEIPEERRMKYDEIDSLWNMDGQMNAICGGFIDDVDKFDPLFFNISPHDAELMDPQERLFLQTAWNAIEDAGYTRVSLSDKQTGVFVGVMYGHYQLFSTQAYPQKGTRMTHSLFSSIANRVSYFLDLHGPSMAIDTMCSSSLTALHLACQSIRQGECDMAVAGGVNLTLHPDKYRLLNQGNFLSSGGRCRSFGVDGDGYVPGEGVGAVLLKPFHLALRDGDHIYGVIKSSSINHGGKTNGYTVPNPAAQADVIAQAYRRANLDPRNVSYIEAHGTGTLLGDPVEISGLARVFSPGDRLTSCAIGSVKSNIGHCESAAGIAALTKVLLQLKHKKLVPSLHADRLNDNIDWQGSGFRVQQELSDWEPAPRMAGISAFGAGGSNAHVIIEEAPDSRKPGISFSKPSYLFAFSAKTETALMQKLDDFYRWLCVPDSEISLTNSLDDISYTLNVCRSHFEKRCAVVAHSVDELKRVLLALKTGTIPDLAMINRAGTLKKPNQSLAIKLFNQLIQELNRNQEMRADEYREHLLTLAGFYVDGYEMDFVNLYQGKPYRKLSLPAYPFDKLYCWYKKRVSIPEAVNQSGVHPDKNTVSLLENVKSRLTSIVSAQLGIRMQDINETCHLSDYGMDSVHFIKLSSQLNDYYGISITPAWFYTNSSIAAISRRLIEEFRSQVSSPRHEKIMSMHTSHDPAAGIKVDALFEAQPVRDIAIIGIQGLFPQSKDLQAFWDHLAAGHDLVTEIPADRWDWRQYYGDIKQNADKMNCKWGAFIDGVDCFDAGFFNISAREAKLMDPQQRLFLEIIWKTIEDAGYDPFTFSGKRVGVFAGVEFNDYQVMLAKRQKEFHGYIATGNSHSMLANRISYFLNLLGPSEVTDTACSGSLVAIHRAVSAIRNGECEMALAGGVSLILNPDTYVVTSQLGAISARGRCKTFDKEADGYVKGEGVAAILLKPLSRALNDGDHVYGIIKNTAVNHGGKAQSLTAPNAAAQSALLIDAYMGANIDPATVTYIETHGTGTALGDPVEIESLKLAFRHLLSNGVSEARIALGSVKTNIGHLEPASGIAGLIKVLLAMAYGKLPGNVHLEEVNPYIDLTGSPFHILRKSQPWIKLKDSSGRDVPYRAGVSSFGFGGTNAHIVIEQGPIRQPARPLTKPFYLLTISAKHSSGVKQKIADLHDWLVDNKQGIDLDSLCYTLNAGRAHFENRTALVVESMHHLLDTLQALMLGKQIPNCMNTANNTKDIPVSTTNDAYHSALSVLNDMTLADREKFRRALMVLGELYCEHYPIDWTAVYSNASYLRAASLPGYPFNRQKYWFGDPEISRVKSSILPVPSSHSEAGLDIIHYLRGIFADKLHIAIDHIKPDQTYEIYGVDSLTGLEITERLEKDFGVLSKTLLYEYNTLKDLSAYFKKYHAGALQALMSHAGCTPNGAANDTAAVERENMECNIDSGIAVSGEAMQADTMDIAVVGLSGVFPMAANIHEFWQNLITARDCIEEIPPERWNYKDYPVTVGGVEKYFRYGGFLRDVDMFDPLFFNISPHDAAIMDPQERIFLQSVWTTLEDGGYTRKRLQETANNEMGVFAGITYNYYPLLIAEDWKNGNQLPVDLQTFSVANRVSYFLNLSGPSFVIDTACSSSLAAIHLACESLRRGECKMAVAGGVNLSLHPGKFHFLGSFNFMSEEGRCASFAEGGKGYVPAEGAGTVLLKPLAAAIRDHDRIYGIIKGSAMNHGGKTSGYTVPNPKAQSDLIRSALQKAGIHPRSISYIEAHGTGTALGDPIEIRGLQNAFEEFTQDRQFCAVGSVKSNIGHLEAAAGISQLAKVLLQMQYKKLAPTLHAENLNPYIDFSHTPFYVQRELSEWRSDTGMPRRAGISSFGAGGTNVHLIVEEYLASEMDTRQRTGEQFAFILSAMNAERLRDYIMSVHDYLRREAENHHDDLECWLRDICYTAQTGRETMPARLAVVAFSYQDLMSKLKLCMQKSRPVMDRVWINDSARPGSAQEGRVLSGELSREEQLAELWVNGANISWEPLHSSSRSLVYFPTYPFAKRRCWFSNHPAAIPENASVTKIKPSLSLVANTVTKRTKWVIFSDLETGFLLQDGLGESSCLYCFSGDHFDDFQHDVIYLNPDHPDDYKRLFSRISADPLIELQGVVYLWTMNGSSTRDDARNNQRLLYLIQSLIQQNWKQPMTFLFVTRECSPSGEHESDRNDIVQHHLWNLAEYFRSEQLAHQVSLLSLTQTKALRKQAGCIAFELQNRKEGHDRIWYVENERYAKALTNPPRFIEPPGARRQSEERLTRTDISLDDEYVTSLVMNSLANMLGLDVSEIDPDVAYLNYGMDSIKGINFVARINESFPDLLSPMDLYRYPNARQLVNHIINFCGQMETPESAVSDASICSVTTENEFMSSIAHLDNAQVARLLEDEFSEIEALFSGQGN
ncbi:Polyketide synthase PksL [Aquicella siphonis]|uniref:Polyketide synthase PksL n=1 Tax=Aquicella siphonis TaxID=254247 RepID=A0A5E4PLS3_9COXI|nr:SDR family NAD(P)-dependent oxidoreductase [Aquicella siphonis]VVC77176.1 Polyketide synthase PksL [Aquicella siphonis]